MTASKHTPGSWRLLFKAAQGVWVIEGPGRFRFVAFVIAHDAEDEANARLIAAAPDLLAALRALFYAFENDDTVAGTEAIRNARAAIKSATGSEE